MKLSTKIIGGFAMSIIMMAVVVGIYQFTVSTTTSGFSGLLKGSVAVLMHAGQVEEAMLQCRRDEKDFLLKKDLKYQDKLHEHIAIVQREAEAIKSIKQKTGGDQQMQNEADKIIQYAATYVEQFDLLVEAQKEAGLTPDSGFQGVFSKAANELQNALPEHDVDNLYIALLELRRYEKDYYRVGSNENRDIFVSYMHNFTAIVTASLADAIAKQHIQEALDSYQQAADQFMTLENKLKKAMAYNTMRKSAQAMEAAIKTIKVPGALALGEAIRRHEKNYLLSKNMQYADKVHAAVDTLNKSFVDAGVLQEHIADIKRQLDAYIQNFDAMVGEYKKVAQANSIVRDTAHLIEPLALKIYQDSQVETNAKSSDIIEMATASAFTAIAIAAGLMIITMFISFYLTRSITAPIGSIIKDLAGGAELVSAASGQVLSSSQGLAEGASEQAAAIEETSATMEEMSSMTSQNSDNAIQADSLMKENLKAIDIADSAMTNISESMNEISSASEETSKIIKTIDEIAFQTNLLALNAAVEAARAGEAGAGFAVVADEVRNLAMRAAAAAKDTSDLIDTTVIKVNKGKEVVTEANKSFSEVTASSTKIGSLVSEIASASQEQAQGFTQINQAITQMDGVTQQNSATAEESAAAAAELNSQSSIMMNAVDALKTMMEGRQASQTGAVKSASDKSRTIHRQTIQSAPAPTKQAPPKAKQIAASSTPEDIIPMDGDDDFEDF